MSCQQCSKYEVQIAELEQDYADASWGAELEVHDDMLEKLTTAAAIVHRLHCADDICICPICEWHRRHR